MRCGNMATNLNHPVQLPWWALQYWVLSIQHTDIMLFIRPRLWVLHCLQISAQLCSSFISTGWTHTYQSCCWSLCRKLQSKIHPRSSFSRHSSPFAHGQWFGDYDGYKCGSEWVGSATFYPKRGASLGVLFCGPSSLTHFLSYSTKHAVVSERLSLELWSLHNMSLMIMFLLQNAHVLCLRRSGR